MKKLTALALLFTFFWGCEVIDNGGGTCPDVPPFFDINELNLSNRLFETYCCGDELPNHELVDFDQYRIYGEYGFTLHAHQPAKGGFLSRSYALSCVAGGYEGSKETIEDFTVTTNFDINENYLAGDTINDLIVFNDFLTERPLNELLNSEDRSILAQWFYLELTEKPTATDTAAFTVTLLLDNGERYTEATPNVIFR